MLTDAILYCSGVGIGLLLIVLAAEIERFKGKR